MPIQLPSNPHHATFGVVVTPPSPPKGDTPPTCGFCVPTSPHLFPPRMSSSINKTFLINTVKSVGTLNAEVEKDKCWESRNADRNLEALVGSGGASTAQSVVPPPLDRAAMAREREANALVKAQAMALRQAAGVLSSSSSSSSAAAAGAAGAPREEGESRGRRRDEEGRGRSRSASPSYCSTCTCSQCSVDELEKRRAKRDRRRRRRRERERH